MQVSVETLTGLERKITISVPTTKVEEEVGLRIRDLARRAKMDGFRPGRAPLSLVKKRYSEDVRQDVMREMVQSTLYEALKEKDLVPAGYPNVMPEQFEEGKDFRYTATFEVFPTIEIKELDNATIELVKAEATDADVDAMITKLREQNKDWKEAKRSVEKGDKVTMNFEGFIDGKAFDGGQADDFELEIGSGSMIPGFEDGLIGAEIGKELDLNVNFPEGYGHAELAGKAATFKVTVTAVKEGKLPKLDDAFAEKFNIKEGGVDALKKDIRSNMERELERRVSSLNREATFNKLMEKNAVDLPMSMVDQEIEHLKHDMFHRIFGQEHHDNEKIPDFPREMFEEQAKRRVHLGLVFAEYVKLHQIKADEDRVNAMIDKLASAYEDPRELRDWYQQDKERLADLEALVIEEIVSEKIRQHAKVIEKKMKYDDVMNPKKDNDEQGV